MATVILRPTSTTSHAGWNGDPMPKIGDNNASTAVIQNSVTCNFVGVLADLDSGLSGATINNFTISLIGKAGRAGASTVAMSLVHSSDGAFASENESFGGSTSTQTTSARTTQQDGSSALTYAYINNCSVKIIPNTQGISAYELFVTVDYTAAAAGYGNDVIGVASANIGKVNGVATGDIEKVNGR
tara:strand:- start:3595 stop:4152 length:558 start_codon:yes stop_codon:yes gene_type:complete